MKIYKITKYFRKCFFRIHSKYKIFNIFSRIEFTFLYYIFILNFSIFNWRDPACNGRRGGAV